MKDISEKRLSDYMAEQIADEILSGRIPGGSQLKQEELAEAFEASRIPDSGKSGVNYPPCNQKNYGDRIG